MAYKLTRLDGVDTFNLLAHEKLGAGIHREVFTCRIRDDLVVKLEYNDTGYRNFANVREAQFWADHQHYDKVAHWLAPVEYVSPDGRILLQRRCKPIADDELPDQLPVWMTDIKAENFGRLEDRIVLLDYAMTVPLISNRLKKWR